MLTWGSPARRSWPPDEEMSLLPVEEEPPVPGQRSSKRRLVRHRLMQTAVPCALLAGVLVAIVFTVGHTGTTARRVARRSFLSGTDGSPWRRSTWQLQVADEAAPAFYSRTTTLMQRPSPHEQEPQQQPPQQHGRDVPLDSADYWHEAARARREAQRHNREISTTESDTIIRPG